MPDYEPDYDWDPTDWKRERQAEEEAYWREQEAYWERYRRWKRKKEEEESRLDERVWLIIILVAVLMLCGSMVFAM